MKRLSLLLACIALLLPLAAGQFALHAQEKERGKALLQAPGAPLGFDAGASQAFRIIDRSKSDWEQNQVRIERRVTVRIAPRSRARDTDSLAPMPSRSSGRKLMLVDHDDCINLNAIVGVQPGERNQLLLFTRDRQIVAATLERKCSAQAFYSGFYVERAEDGQICVGREELQSRAGASCGVADLHSLVEVAS